MFPSSSGLKTSRKLMISESMRRRECSTWISRKTDLTRKQFSKEAQDCREHSLTGLDEGKGLLGVLGRTIRKRGAACVSEAPGRSASFCLFSTCLVVISLPLPSNDFHEGSCGFGGVFEQNTHVSGQFLTGHVPSRLGGWVFVSVCVFSVLHGSAGKNYMDSGFGERALARNFAYARDWPVCDKDR